MKRSIYDTGYIATMKLSLRRTRVRSVRPFGKCEVSLLLVIFSFIASEVKLWPANKMKKAALNATLSSRFSGRWIVHSF